MYVFLTMYNSVRLYTVLIIVVSKLTFCNLLLEFVLNLIVGKISLGYSQLNYNCHIAVAELYV